MGYVSVTAGIASQGQGHATMLARLCAEVLEVPLERIRVRLGDTGLIPYGVGTWGSRGAVAAGNAVWEAASSVREKAVRMAAALLEVTPTDVCWEAGAAYLVGLPDRRLDLAELARASAPSRGALLLPEGPGLEGRAFFTPAGTTYANGAHAALVEIDVQQGTVKLRRYLVSHDCGRVIDQVGVDGQIVGAVAQGVGAALLEQLAYDEAGQVATASLMDYLLPTAVDVPVVELRHRETPSPRNPLGFKGVGEGGLIPSASAIAGAVDDALAPFGVQLREIPITPDRLVHLLRRD
jgi:carbon-monoxide dehydrogenase large subunit